MAKCDAIHAIINSSCLLFILKALFNIECHFLFILIYIYIHTHTQPCSNCMKVSTILLRTGLVVHMSRAGKVLRTHTHTHILLLNHWATSSIYFYLFFFFFKLFFLLLFSKKQKRKPLLLLVSPHLQLHFLQLFPSFFAFLPPFYSLFHRYTSFIIFTFL